MIRFEEIHHVHLEPSSRCQAKCPLCSRNKWGWGERKDFIQTDLTLEKCKLIFDKFDRRQLTRIDMNGNFGDPCINPEIREIVDYLFRRFPRLTLGIMTNGGMHKPEWWTRLIPQEFIDKAEIFFSIDGLEDTNHLYRIGVPYEKAMENAKAFISVGGSATWKWVPFRHNEHQLDEAKQRGKDLGFKYFEVTDQNRDYAYVASGKYWIRPISTKQDRLHWENHEKLSQVSDKTFAYMYFSPGYLDDERSSKYQDDSYFFCHTKEWKSIYVDSQGNAWPCCFLGHDPRVYTTQHAAQQLEMMGDIDNNLAYNDFDKVTAWWKKIEDSWAKPTIREGLMRTCLTSCHRCKDE